jgi:hypothetical protein
MVERSIIDSVAHLLSRFEVRHDLFSHVHGRSGSRVAPRVGTTHPNGECAEPPQFDSSTTRARQGVTGHNVRYVLGFGIAAVIVAFIVVYLYV